MGLTDNFKKATIQHADSVPGVKRKVGRPKGSTTKSSVPIKTPPNLEESLVVMITMLNTPFVAMATFGKYGIQADDPLNEEEIKEIASALYKQAQRSVIVAKWLTNFVVGGEKLGAGLVLFAIAGKRVVNHTALPPVQKMMFKAMLDNPQQIVDMFAGAVASDVVVEPPTDNVPVA